ncbi:MAG: DUF1501 domain-containing protein [Acidobacteria bacterium]|nr:DUF1501 domain-containing protein [Acidobacteriota bacterium]
MKLDRRWFLKLSGMATLSGGCRPAWGSPPPAAAPSPVLVILEMLGGNDGLNTVIPYSEATYYDQRPTVAVAEDEVRPLDDRLGLHPGLVAWEPLWSGSEMAVVLGVGYPDPDLSHFRSTDIWRGGSTAPVIATGWLGRYLETLYPDYPDVRPEAPLAIEVKSADTLLLRGQNQGMGMAVNDPEALYQLTSGWLTVHQTPAPAGRAGDELVFVRSLAETSSVYAEKIYSAFTAAVNAVSYPATPLATELSMVARLIAGGLATPVYSVLLSGFDTHVEQSQVHPGLLRTVAGAVAAFLADLDALGIADQVVLMTMSEFGRRVRDNGSGTDHGTAAPLFLFGRNVRGGFCGAQPDLRDLDDAGNMIHVVDFRQVYASVLQQWFGATPALAAEILAGDFPPLPLFVTTGKKNSGAPTRMPPMRRQPTSRREPADGLELITRRHRVP